MADWKKLSSSPKNIIFSKALMKYTHCLKNIQKKVTKYSFTGDTCPSRSNLMSPIKEKKLPVEISCSTECSTIKTCLPLPFPGQQANKQAGKSKYNEPVHLTIPCTFITNPGTIQQSSQRNILCLRNNNRGCFLPAPRNLRHILI